MVKTGVNKIIPETISQFALRFNEKEIKKSILPSGRKSSVQETPKFVFKEDHKKKTYDAFTKLYKLITYELEKSSRQQIFFQ